MQSFKNFIHGLFVKVKKSKDHLPSFYRQIKISDILWISLAINQKTMAQSLLTKECEILLPDESHSLKLAEVPDGLFIQMGKNQKEIAQSTLHQTLLPTQDFNHFIDELLEQQIQSFQKKLNTLATKTLTPNELALEEKALEWIRATFIVLEKAVLESLTNPDLLFQLLLFMGINPKNQLKEIRLIVFNLDMHFTFLENGFLRIHIYDDKNKELGHSQKAALSGDYVFRRREIFDELTKMLSTLSKGIKFV